MITRIVAYSCHHERFYSFVYPLQPNEHSEAENFSNKLKSYLKTNEHRRIFFVYRCAFEPVGNIVIMDRVSLILGEDRLEVNREDLISRSEYFASLFSSNFKDSLNSEHRINYNIHINTLRTFVDWTSEHVQSDPNQYNHAKPSLAKFVGNSVNFDELLELLELGVLLVAETLIKDLTDLIACNWLMPQRCVQIWLLARELSLSTLRDIAKATCVDRLRVLPDSSLLELPAEDFIELVGNIRTPIDEEFPLRLTQLWNERNVSAGQKNAFESRYPFTLLAEERCSFENYERLRRDIQWRHNIQCVIGRKWSEETGLIYCICGWDGTEFSEIVEIPSFSMDVPVNFSPLQIVGRGFDIYIIGDQLKWVIRSSSIILIWRYSMISRTWYYVTSVPRSEDVKGAAFVGDNLCLISRGRRTNRFCDVLVDVYNISTGKWCMGANGPDYTIFKPLTICKENESLMVYFESECAVHLYNPDKNLWSYTDSKFVSVKYNENGDLIEETDINPFSLMTDNDNNIYIYGTDDDSEPQLPQIYQIKDREHLKTVCLADALTWPDIGQRYTCNWPYLIGIAINDGIVTVTTVKIDVNDASEAKIVIRDKRSCTIRGGRGLTGSGSNVFNPKGLNELIPSKDHSE